MTIRPIALLVALALAAPLLAAEADPAPPKDKAAPKKKEEAAKEQEPIHIWADHIRYLRDENLALITGTVTIIKGDLRIDADGVRATLEPGTNRFQKITATGNVRMYKIIPIGERTTERPPLKLAPEGRSATCDIAVYEPAKGRVVLFGSPEKPPVVFMGKDQIQADRITYDRDKNVMNFEGKVRLTALIPKGTGEPTPPKPAPKSPPKPAPAASPEPK